MAEDLTNLRSQWLAAWPQALETWSRFVQLSPPHWCVTTDEESHERLTGSFAMIRLTDHTVVISLRQVRALRLENFAHQVLAHEIGHHVYCPADLTDNARLLARTRAGLPTKERLAPMVANLYTDLLINDRLQRSDNLDMAAVYRALGSGDDPDTTWTLYMRIYEILWSLPRASLAPGVITDRLNQDASLGARLIRSYARDWLDGAGRFACLCLPYLIDDEGKRLAKIAGRWHDTRDAGAGGLPEGLVEIEDAETAGAIHPAEDPELSGIEGTVESKDVTPAKDHTGRKSLKNYRQPFEYAEVMKAAGATAPEAEIVARYYRELALPHLVRFPQRLDTPSTDPHPEGLDVWDVGSPIEVVDWLGTVLASPQVIPGITTVRREFGASPGHTPSPQPIDLYLGVDCSGSMGNPAGQLSYPVLAGAIIALSALRTGSRVMVALSGEPGKTITTEGFIRDEKLILATLTSYLGTGTTFGIHRLTDTFAPKTNPSARPVHILIVTDNDIFRMLDTTTDKPLTGWQIARQSLAFARGGGTMVLQFPQYLMNRAGAAAAIHPGCKRLEEDGWTVANVDSMDQLLEFAKRFSRSAYGTTRQTTVAKP